MSSETEQAAEIEDCPELDDEFFDHLDFMVVDQWNEIKKELETNERPKGQQSNRNHSSKGHSELRKSPAQTRSRTRSKTPNNFATNKQNMSPARSRNWQQTDRNRSPDRKRNRRISLDRRRPSRNLRNNDGSASERFLKELQEKFAQQGTSAPEVENLLRQKQSRQGQYQRMTTSSSNNYNNNSQQMQFMNQFNHNSQNFNAMAMANAQMLNIASPVISPFPNSYVMLADPYANISMQQSVVVPQPVPPPSAVISPLFENSNDPHILGCNPPAPVISTATTSTTAQSQQTAASSKALTAQDAQKKALAKGQISITDFLKQRAKQRTVSNFSAQKAEVIIRCKKAANLMNAIDKSGKIKLPLVGHWSKEVPSTKSDEESNCSPLVANSHNLKFAFQTPAADCRTAVKNNPLRVISDSLLVTAQKLRIDPVELAQKVAKEVASQEIKQESIEVEPTRTATQVSSSTVPIVSSVRSRNVSAASQTETYECEKCKAREKTARSMKTIATQSNLMILQDAETQCDTTNDFTFTVDAKTLQNRSFEQHHALEVFVKAFHIPCSFLKKADDFEFGKKFIAKDLPTFEEHLRRISDDERLHYSNPENPHASRQDPFVSLSPIRKRTPEMPSMLQRRMNIFNRIGDRVASPNDRFNRRQSPLDPTILTRQNPPSSPPRLEIRRSRSPLESRMAFFKNRSRSISPRFRNNSRSRDRFPSPVRSSNRSRDRFPSPVRSSNRFPSPVRHRSRSFDRLPSPMHKSSHSRDRFPSPGRHFGSRSRDRFTSPVRNRSRPRDHSPLQHRNQSPPPHHRDHIRHDEFLGGRRGRY